MVKGVPGSVESSPASSPASAAAFFLSSASSALGGEKKPLDSHQA